MTNVSDYLKAAKVAGAENKVYCESLLIKTDMATLTRPLTTENRRQLPDQAKIEAVDAHEGGTFYNESDLINCRPQGCGSGNKVHRGSM